MAEQQGVRLCKRGHPQIEANICRSKTGENKGCRLCARIIVAAWNEKNRERSNKLSKERYYANKEKRLLQNRRYTLKTKYNTTPEEVKRRKEKQNNLCAICFQSDGKELHIDHDHKTGEFRGLLCGNHNWGLGLFKDNPRLFMSAVMYLSVGMIS